MKVVHKTSHSLPLPWMKRGLGLIFAAIYHNTLLSLIVTTQLEFQISNWWLGSIRLKPWVLKALSKYDNMVCESPSIFIIIWTLMSLFYKHDNMVCESPSIFKIIWTLMTLFYYCFDSSFIIIISISDVYFYLHEDCRPKSSFSLLLSAFFKIMNRLLLESSPKEMRIQKWKWHEYEKINMQMSSDLGQFTICWHRGKLSAKWTSILFLSSFS